MKSRINNKLMVSIVSTLAPACALGVVAGIVVNAIKPTEPETLQTIVDKMNAKLAAQTKKATTMKEALELTKSICDAEFYRLGQGEFIWDQEVDQFAVVDFSTQTPTVLVKTGDYQLNSKPWRVWRMINVSDFDSYSQYSQYLKTTNDSTDGVYSVIAGFDCGNNENVKNVHYFYEKMDTQEAKDIIINTNSKQTNVDISAWDGNGVAGAGDKVNHYGQMCELTIVTNDVYIENGIAISCTAYDGEIAIASDKANIELTYVRSVEVKLANYKQTGELIDEIYTDSTDPTIKTAIEAQHYTVESDHDVEESVYQTTKEEAIEDQGGEVQHVFTVTGGEQNEYYDSFSAIAAASNDANNPEYFEGKTITLNKDYDMSIESASWVPICNYDDDTGSAGKAFKGTIDGNGHTILNFNLNVSTGNPGLINTNAGSVKNLNFRNCSLNNSGGRACLVAVWNRLGNMTFENLNFYNCNVTSQRSNGFAFGYVTGTGTNVTFKNCHTDDKSWVKGTTYHYLYQTGFVSQICDGVSSALFEDCEMKYKVQSVYCAGSYIGQLGSVNSQCPNVTFKNCTSYGDVVCIEGAFAGNGPMMGGFVGTAQNNAQTDTEPTTVLFDHCTNYSKVYAEDKFVNIDSLGGFIGYGNNPKNPGSVVSFVDCVNEGEIGRENELTGYTPNYAGGFYGRTNGNTNITIKFTRCENKGYVNATTAGHFMGLLDYKTAEILEYRICEDCTISGSLRSGAARTQITGEP